MSVEINYLAVVLAMVSSMVVGAVWYAKGVMGNKWAKLVKVDLDSEKTRKAAPRAMAITVVVSLITAYVLAHFTYLAHTFYLGDYSFFATALITAFWAWLGFTAARMITHDAFEQRPMQLTVMNCLHELVTLMVMALVIGGLGV